MLEPQWAQPSFEASQARSIEPLYLQPFDCPNPLTDLPDIGELGGFLRGSLEFAEQLEACAGLPDPGAAKCGMHSMSSLDSAASSTGREPPSPGMPPGILAFPTPLAPPGMPDLVNYATASALQQPDALMHAISEQPTSLADTDKASSDPESSEQAKPARRERKRRSTVSTGTRLAKQREKNRRCQRSFRERQKVKQEAIMTELQELRDRCALLESELAAAKASKK